MPSSDNGVYYFLGNITSHILHALPLHKELGGTFVVLSDKAKKEVERYGVPVIALNNQPYRWTRFGWKLKPVFHYPKIGKGLKVTTDFLNANAKVVIFYELYDFAEPVRLTGPKTVFLTHGNMLKDYMNPGRLKLVEQYDYMAALGPYLKKKFIEDGMNPKKLIDLGIARTDEVVKHKGNVVVSEDIIKELGINPNKKIVAYLPTFWGASSIYTAGFEIVKNIPDDYTLLFRPHPQTPAKLLREYRRIIRQKSNVVYAPEGQYSNLGLIDIFNASSVIIGDISSVMLEAVLTRKPMLFAYDIGSNKQLDSNYVSVKDVVERSETINTDTASELSDLLRQSLHFGVDKHLWQQVVDRNFYHADGTSVASIANFVRSLL